MDRTPAEYRDVVETYIQVIKQDSPNAAVIVEEILSVFGSRIALHITLAMTLLKMEVQQHHITPDVSTYAYMFRKSPEALPFLERAMNCWLQDRRIQDEKIRHSTS